MKKTTRRAALALALCVMLLSGSGMPAYAHGTHGTNLDATQSFGGGKTDEDTPKTQNNTPADPQKNSDAENKERLEELQQISKELADERKKIQQSINNAKSEKEKQVAIKNTLDGKLNNAVAQIGVLDEKVVLLKDQIQLTEERIRELQQSIEENYQLFLERVRASYMYGDIKPISVVLGADNYYDSLVSMKTIESVADHDNELIRSLNEDKEEVEQALAELEDNKKELETSINQLEEEKANFQKDIANTQNKIADIALLEKEFLSDLAANQKKSKELQAEMDAIFAQINSQGEYVGGVMMWPLPGYSTISSYYGPRWNGKDFHTGLDITGSGVNGQTIVAANSGTVAKVNTAVVPGKGYGKYVMIDHGGGMVSLYGHCSAILVSEGQTVAKGSPIAKVGSTGWSTGPHLHFEVRKNNQHVNPLQYLKG